MFRIASFQFGYAMYAASVAGATAPQWSDRVDEAHTYDHRDNRSTKLTYWKAYAEVQGLDPEKVRIVEVAPEVPAGSLRDRKHSTASDPMGDLFFA